MDSPAGRPTRLVAAQLQELRARVLQHPEMCFAELADMVEARFGVRYTFHGLRLLLRKELGLETHPGMDLAKTSAGMI